MPSSHLIFIPAVLLVGVVIGFILGGRAAEDKMNLEIQKDKERAKARARREARKAAKNND